jgi:DNA-directed RNA polymerase specialized sigma24 family protein
MVAPNKRRSQKSAPAWHKSFLRVLPKIVSYARTAFQYRDPESREDLVQEVVANACVAFKALWDRGKQALAYPTVLASYAIRQVKDGRRVGNRLNVREVLSKYAQQHKGFVVVRLDKFDDEEGQWQEVIVEDRHAGPADIARTRIDFSDWLGSLKRRDRRVAEFLANGETTTTAAKKFKISAGRISQLRRELAESWRAFVGDEPTPEAA